MERSPLNINGDDDPPIVSSLNQMAPESRDFVCHSQLYDVDMILAVPLDAATPYYKYTLDYIVNTQKSIALLNPTGRSMHWGGFARRPTVAFSSCVDTFESSQ